MDLVPYFTRRYLFKIGKWQTGNKGTFPIQGNMLKTEQIFVSCLDAAEMRRLKIDAFSRILFSR